MRVDVRRRIDGRIDGRRATIGDAVRWDDDGGDDDDGDQGRRGRARTTEERRARNGDASVREAPALRWWSGSWSG